MTSASPGASPTLTPIWFSQRIRHYCNVVVFWAWLARIMEANASLSKKVSLVQAWCNDLGLPVPGKDTSAYSKGRRRLKPAFLIAVNKRIKTYSGARIRPEDTYHGDVVKSIDGSSMTLDDTEENQAEYPQPTSQKSGCGFPVMGIMGSSRGRGDPEAFYVTKDAVISWAIVKCRTVITNNKVRGVGKIKRCRGGLRAREENRSD